MTEPSDPFTLKWGISQILWDKVRGLQLPKKPPSNLTQSKREKQYQQWWWKVGRVAKVRKEGFKLPRMPLDYIKRIVGSENAESLVKEWNKDSPWTRTEIIAERVGKPIGFNDKKNYYAMPNLRKQGLMGYLERAWSFIQLIHPNTEFKYLESEDYSIFLMQKGKL